MKWSKFVIQSGMVASLIGVTGSLGAGYFSHLEAEQSAEIKRIEIAETARSERTKNELSQKAATCNGMLTYLGDDTPNPNLTPEFRTRLETVMLNGLQNCSMRPADSNRSAPEANQ